MKNFECDEVVMISAVFPPVIQVVGDDDAAVEMMMQPMPTMAATVQQRLITINV